MILAEVSVRRPVFATMMITALCVFGIIGFKDIGVDLFPEVDFPFVTVTTVLPGASPEIVETEVTDKIEEVIMTIDGIKALRSSSYEGVSQVLIQFELEEDVDIVAQDVRAKVDSIRRDLPQDIDPPLVEKFSFGSMPIISVSLFGEQGIGEITEFAKDYVKDRLQTISGVGRVRMVGGREREIRVWLDSAKLRGYGIAVDDVRRVLQTENVEIPGGRIDTGPQELVVKTRGEVERVADFANLMVSVREGKPVYLRDLGYVEDGLEEERSLVKWNEKRAVAMDCFKQSGTNTVELAEALKAEIEEIQKVLPEGLRMEIAMDNSFFITESIHEVQKNLIEGSFFASFVIFFFLRNFRATLIAATAIPVSVISTFSFMDFLGFTMNNLTMLALTISVGMLIDDAIVVMENIYRHMEAGESPIEAALSGTKEIGLAVTATTFSIVAVFVPVAFMTGLVGRFFYEFGLTVAFAVLVSLFVSFTLTPMLCSRFLRTWDWRKSWVRPVFHVVEITLDGINRVYRVLLDRALRFRWITLGVGLLIFIFSLMLAGLIPSEFAPQQDEAEFTVFLECPLGSSLQETLRRVEEIEWDIRGFPWVEALYTKIGGNEQQKVNLAEILVKMVPTHRRSFNQVQAMEAIRAKLSIYDDVVANVVEAQRMASGGWKSQLFQLSIQGPDLAVLDRIAKELLGRMEARGDFVDIDTSYRTGKPEVAVHLNRRKIEDMGLSIYTIASTINTLVGGEDVSVYREMGKQYEVRIRLKEDDRMRPEDILKLTVRAPGGELVELGNVARVSEESGPVEITRFKRQREIMIYANLQQTLPLGNAVALMESWIEEAGLPPGYITKFEGMADIMEESFQSMNFALLLAIVLIYMTLSSQYESFIHPFTIMLSLPMSIVGAMGALYLSGLTMNIFSMIGIIMLMGLVTKNAILLVDFTNQLRAQGLDKHAALLKAGPIRLRPILMTAVSTIAGAVPVAFFGGAGNEWRVPMAICVIGGMATSTFLTLLIVPVVYSLLDGLRELRIVTWVRKKTMAGGA
jgi:HAE1 family hydrophobic/amphiphilic exporter-1